LPPLGGPTVGAINQQQFFVVQGNCTSMTMVSLLRSSATGRMRVAGMVWMATVLAAASAGADEPPVHFLHAGAMPPGAIGSLQLTRGGPLPGYFQPVEIMAPEGAMVSLAAGADFMRPAPGPLGAGMLIGAVYRAKVTNIPLHQGLEVYPTIEVIDRLYPPLGQERRFPIPIQITQEEIEMALSGRFVTRVIYLEDPQNPLPVAQQPDDQSCFEIEPGDNPLDVADRLGRPMAILRLGARLPDAQGPDATFLYNSPPWIKFQPVAIERPAVPPPTGEPVDRAKDQTASAERASVNYSTNRQPAPAITSTARW
jgi:hypothetical protein